MMQQINSQLNNTTNHATSVNNGMEPNSSICEQWVSGSEVDATTGVFEGPEKTLEVSFNSKVGRNGGLRNLSRAQLDLLCKDAKCTILSSISTKSVDAYVLSESSLFVYEHRYIMKTCGTTTLLRALKSLFEFTDELEMELTCLMYSRKNLNFPKAQLWPHVNFGEEIRYIDSQESVKCRLNGHGYVLGPVTGDHWFVYAAKAVPHPAKADDTASGRVSSPVTVTSRNSLTQEDSESADESESTTIVTRTRGNTVNSNSSDGLTDNADTATTTGSSCGSLITPSQSVTELQSLWCQEEEMSSLAQIPTICGLPPRSAGATEPRRRQQLDKEYRTFNMMMFDMDPAVAATFFQGTNGLTGKEMTVQSGIQKLCPKANIDEAAFTPCGYSMNALEGSTYYTIHITPEEAGSYVSFETNVQLENYAALVRQVLATFKPGRFVLTFFGDDQFMTQQMGSLPTHREFYRAADSKDAGAASIHYARSSSTCTKLDVCGQRCSMACFRRTESASELFLRDEPLAERLKCNNNIELGFMPRIVQKARSYSIM